MHVEVCSEEENKSAVMELVISLCLSKGKCFNKQKNTHSKLTI